MPRSRSRLLAGAAAEHAQGLIVRGADTAQRDLSGWPATGFAKALDQQEDAGRRLPWPPPQARDLNQRFRVIFLFGLGD